MKRTIKVENGQMLAVAQYQAEKTGRSWFLIGDTNKVCDAVGRKGWEQYPHLEITPSGEMKLHESNPRQ